MVVPVALGIYFQDKKYLSVDEAVAYRKKCTEKIKAKQEAQLEKDPEHKAKLEKEKEENDHRAWLKRNKDLQDFLEIRSKISLNDTRLQSGRLISDKGSTRDMGFGHGHG
jgi:hypothetical protein